MNDICEMWSLPWHALLKNLAVGLAGGDMPVQSAAALRPVTAQGVGVSANSWLRRAQHRAIELSAHPFEQGEPEKGGGGYKCSPPQALGFPGQAV